MRFSGAGSKGHAETGLFVPTAMERAAPQVTFPAPAPAIDLPGDLATGATGSLPGAEWHGP